MHQSSIVNMRRFRRFHLNNKENTPLRIIDLGSTDINGSYRDVLKNLKWSYIGVDLNPGENVDTVLSDPYAWKEFRTDSIDVVVSGQTFEHIPFFWITFLEIARILKPGGLCCIIAPSAGPEHRFPVDCWRFYPDGFTALANFGKLQVIACKTDWEPIQQYSDMSASWQDTVLVCRKPETDLIHRLRNRIWRFLLLKALHFRSSDGIQKRPELNNQCENGGRHASLLG